MEIDNFDVFEKHLTFTDKTDRYIVHILRRPKDCKQISSTWGSNECQRLLRTYYIDSIEYFNRKRDAIKELCTTNRARAYILPQVRNNYECLLNLGEKVLETIRLGNFSAKPEHLLRSAYCEYHKSRSKKWIIDLDSSEMYGWTVDDVLELVRSQLRKIGKSDDEAYLIQTKSGHHIVTTPFNLMEGYEKCPMLYEGEKTFIEKKPCGPGEYEDIRHKRVGWLHKDGMSLLYLNMD